MGPEEILQPISLWIKPLEAEDQNIFNEAAFLAKLSRSLSGKHQSTMFKTKPSEKSKKILSTELSWESISGLLLLTSSILPFLPLYGDSCAYPQVGGTEVPKVRIFLKIEDSKRNHDSRLPPYKRLSLKDRIKYRFISRQPLRILDSENRGNDDQLELNSWVDEAKFFDATWKFGTTQKSYWNSFKELKKVSYQACGLIGPGSIVPDNLKDQVKITRTFMVDGMLFFCTWNLKENTIQADVSVPQECEGYKDEIQSFLETGVLSEGLETYAKSLGDDFVFKMPRLQNGANHAVCFTEPVPQVHNLRINYGDPYDNPENFKVIDKPDWIQVSTKAPLFEKWIKQTTADAVETYYFFCGFSCFTFKRDKSNLYEQRIAHPFTFARILRSHENRENLNQNLQKFLTWLTRTKFDDSGSRHVDIAHQSFSHHIWEKWKNPTNIRGRLPKLVQTKQYPDQVPDLDSMLEFPDLASSVSTTNLA